MRIALRFGYLVLFVPALFGQAPTTGAPTRAAAGDKALVPVSTSKEVALPAASPRSDGPSTSMAQPKALPAVTDAEPNAPVVTIEGICDGRAATTSAGSAKSPVRSSTKAGAPAKTLKSRKDCKTVITKAQMDAMLDLLVPGASPEQRHAFALNYIRIVAAAGVAQEKKLDHDPAVEKEMQARMGFTWMQVMASSLYRRVETLAQDVQDSEIESYYKQQAGSLIEAEVQRLSLSKLGPRGATVDVTALKAKAEEYHARVAKGEDMEELQKEILTANPASISSAKTATVRRNNLLPEEAVVFNLKPGEITPIVDARGAFEILKLVAVKPIPLETLRPDIKTALANGHLQILMKDATKNVTAKFNLTYLQLPKAPELFLPPSPKPLRPASNGMTSGMAPGNRPAGDPVPQQQAAQ